MRRLRSFEGDTSEPNNYYDVMAVYMVKYGVGETATVMNDTSKTRLKGVFDDMNSYSISYGTITLPDAGGVDVIYSVKYVNVIKKTYRDMISEYGFDADEVKLLQELLIPENLTMIGGC